MIWTKEQVKEYGKEYYKKNKHYFEKYHKQYQKDNKERFSVNSKTWRDKNKKHLKEKDKEYRSNNKHKINIYYANWYNNKIKTDINFKILELLRSRILSAIKKIVNQKERLNY